MAYRQCWECYFGNVIGYTFQVTLLKMSTVTVQLLYKSKVTDYIWLLFDYFSKFLMFSTVNYFQTCKAGRVKLIVVFNTNYCQTFESLHHLNFKGDIGCNISSFAYKCVFAVCEHNHPTM